MLIVRQHWPIFLEVPQAGLWTHIREFGGSYLFVFLDLSTVVVHLISLLVTLLTLNFANNFDQVAHLHRFVVH